MKRYKKSVMLLLIAVFAWGIAACGDSEETPLPDGDTDQVDVDGDTDGDADPQPDGDAVDPVEADGDAVETDGDVDEELPPLYQFPDIFMNQNVRWEVCDLYEGSVGAGSAECADFVVPQRWNGPHSETITVRVKRLRGSGTTTRQMWMLEGGPGGSGIADFGAFMDMLSGLDPDLDLYVPDHRGVGYSTRMGCPVQEADDSDGGFGITEDEMPDCIEYLKNDWGHDPLAFTVTAAAEDLGFLLAYTEEEGVDQFVYGVSYGSYWAERYAQIFPKQPDGIILDSVVPPMDLTFDYYDRRATDVVHEIFDMCAQDEACNSKLGMDPWQFAQDTFEDFENGHCPALVDAGIGPELFKYMVFTLGRSWSLRVHLPALYYRLARCESADVRALYLANLLMVQKGGRVSDTDKLGSGSLGNTIAVSEFLSFDHETSEELAARDASLLATISLGYRTVRAKELGWPLYPTDEFYRQWASRHVPMLMLNGTLDLQTPHDVAALAADHLNGPHQYWVTVPWANHGVITASPVQTQGDPACGTQILLDWIQHPLQAPDTSCIDDLKEVTFEGDPNYVEQIHATTGLYDNEPPALSCTVPDGFGDNDAPDHVSMTMKGRISSLNAGYMIPVVSDVDLMIGGEARMADSLYGMSYQINKEGVQYLRATLQGEYREYSPAHRRFIYTQMALPMQVLNAAVENGETYIAHMSEEGHMFRIYTLDIEEKDIDAARYSKICPLALDIDDEDRGGMYVCHEHNSSFAPNEVLELALRVDLTSDQQTLIEAFQQTDPCICVRNNTQTVECDEYFDQTSEKFVSPPAPAGPYPLPPLMPLTP